MAKFKTKKSLGQNFLENQRIIEQISDLAELDNNTDAIEIGVGSANLTTALAQRSRRVLGFEIDSSLIPILEKKLFNYPNVLITFGDVLKLNFRQEIEEQLKEVESLSLVANIPYYITSPIIHLILESGLKFKNIVLMVQKEVAERLVAKPNTSEYSVLSVYVHEFCEPQIEFIVGKNNFYPVPKVDSAVISLKQFPMTKTLDEIRAEMHLVQLSFANRRKQIKNNLAALTNNPEQQAEITEILTKLFGNSKIRAQELSIEQFQKLLKELKEREIL
ncbi:16S rRNA (adenine(1518)-N(6)/adenine(1519)-N(6))-dimethyltransferase RsmA [Xylocopilactobacillus apicola]|uniref:Ribosomal RNA small subunit methyltransferase A n=1 Tax=Xylocopilactobacillus apicola TaxID=2932184 RepID=A0AAU9D4K6_9LACO|nr:16S rRNA (adenine(1518)-N(6)/adenine(1519)-N(6))-dimethyltransferase RsmA [Xylocopilactobacillus apicola]BDR58438.1 ribosomal RNA small subunit methyltransferase A [Xylocopilactobacillus apicola]